MCSEARHNTIKASARLFARWTERLYRMGPLVMGRCESCKSDLALSKEATMISRVRVTYLDTGAVVIMRLVEYAALTDDETARTHAEMLPPGEASTFVREEVLHVH